METTPLIWIKLGLMLIYLQIMRTWDQQNKIRELLLPTESFLLVNTESFPVKHLNGAWHITVHFDQELALVCERPSSSQVDIFPVYLSISEFENMEYSMLYEPPFTIKARELYISRYSYNEKQNQNYNCKLNSGTRQCLDCSTPCNCGNITIEPSQRKEELSTYGMVLLRNAEKSEFPSAAAIWDKKNSQFVCDGTIIADKVVITAAHCFKDFIEHGRDVTEYGVVTGLNDLRDNIPESMLDVITIKVYPNDARTKSESNDIALVITDLQIIFSEKVSTACLPFNVSKQHLLTRKVVAAGWGMTITMHHKCRRSSDTLQKSAMQIIPDKGCTNSYHRFDQTLNLCLTGDLRRNEYLGTSGTPSYKILGNRYFLVGINVRKNLTDCERGRRDNFEANMNVNHYITWIKTSVPWVKFCEISFVND